MLEAETGQLKVCRASLITATPCHLQQLHKGVASSNLQPRRKHRRTENDTTTPTRAVDTTKDELSIGKRTRQDRTGEALLRPIFSCRITHRAGRSNGHRCGSRGELQLHSHPQPQPGTWWSGGAANRTSLARAGMGGSSRSVHLVPSLTTFAGTRPAWIRTDGLWASDDDHDHDQGQGHGQDEDLLSLTFLRALQVDLDVFDSRKIRRFVAACTESPGLLTWLGLLVGKIRANKVIEMLAVLYRTSSIASLHKLKLELELVPRCSMPQTAQSPIEAQRLGAQEASSLSDLFSRPTPPHTLSSMKGLRHLSLCPKGYFRDGNWESDIDRGPRMGKGIPWVRREMWAKLVEWVTAVLETCAPVIEELQSLQLTGVYGRVLAYPLQGHQPMLPVDVWTPVFKRLCRFECSASGPSGSALLSAINRDRMPVVERLSFSDVWLPDRNAQASEAIGTPISSTLRGLEASWVLGSYVLHDVDRVALDTVVLRNFGLSNQRNRHAANYADQLPDIVPATPIANLRNLALSYYHGSWGESVDWFHKLGRRCFGTLVVGQWPFLEAEADDDDDDGNSHLEVGRLPRESHRARRSATDHTDYCWSCVPVATASLRCVQNILEPFETFRKLRTLVLCDLRPASAPTPAFGPSSTCPIPPQTQHSAQIAARARAVPKSKARLETNSTVYSTCPKSRLSERTRRICAI